MQRGTGSQISHLSEILFTYVVVIPAVIVPHIDDAVSRSPHLLIILTSRRTQPKRFCITSKAGWPHCAPWKARSRITTVPGLHCATPVDIKPRTGAFHRYKVRSIGTSERIRLISVPLLRSKWLSIGSYPRDILPDRVPASTKVQGQAEAEARKGIPLLSYVPHRPTTVGCVI